jgi:iron complex outermembrane receptor protein
VGRDAGAQNFVLGYRDASRPVAVASYETYDLQGTWDGWRGLGVTLGIKNVLDREPAVVGPGPDVPGRYDPRYADPRGRMYYLGLRYAFK